MRKKIYLLCWIAFFGVGVTSPSFGNDADVKIGNSGEAEVKESVAKRLSLEAYREVKVRSPQRLNPLAGFDSISYMLVPKTGRELDVPVLDNQEVRYAKDKVIVIVRNQTVEKGGPLPYKGNDQELKAALEPSAYLNSDDKQIVVLALTAIGDAQEAASAAYSIESFVAEYLFKTSFGGEYNNADIAASSKEGDSTEFAVLTAAMCRAAGIPARVVFGLVYLDEYDSAVMGFWPHAWTQAWVGDQWVGLDAALKSTGRGYGPGHLTLEISETGKPEKFVEMIKSLGDFRIEKVVKRRD